MHIPTHSIYNSANNSCPVCSHTQFHRLFACTDHFVSNENFHILSCSGCGLRITEDFPKEDAMDAYYRSENYISHSNIQKGITNRIYHMARSLMLKKKRSWVENQASGADKKLLDVGCGTGYFAAHMQRHGWDVLGVEKCAAAREFATSSFGLEVAPSIEKIDENIRFNAITLWHVLEHLEDLNGSMQRFYRMLALQGALFIAVPNYKSADAEKYRKFWAAYDVPRHLWHFSPIQMLRLAENHGFEVTTIKPFHLDGFYISIMSEKQKGSPIYFLKGIVSGLKTWLNTLVNSEKSSSLLYVLKKIPEPRKMEMS